MSNVVILSKTQVRNLINNSEYALGEGPPSFVEAVSLFGAGTIIASYILAAKPAAGDVIYGSILTALSYEVDKMSYTQKSRHLNEYKSWLNTMNNNNLIAIKIQQFNYRDVANGVKFTQDIPNILGYQKSDGTWIEVS